ncbi:unnamed protein product [Gadus morhua 'NCC']
MGSLLQAGPACFMKPLPWKERCPPAQTGAQGLAWVIVTLQYCGTQQGVGVPRWLPGRPLLIGGLQDGSGSLPLADARLTVQKEVARRTFP